MPLSTAAPATRADVKDALRSATTCPAHTANAFRNLLCPDNRRPAPKTRRPPGPQEKHRRLAERPAAATAQRNRKVTKATTQTRGAAAAAPPVDVYDEEEEEEEEEEEREHGLTADEKTAFAVEVLNAVLQGLSDAVKQSKGVRSTSSSAPRGLQDRSPNSVPKTKLAKSAKQPASSKPHPPAAEDGYLQVLADCGGLALEHLCGSETSAAHGEKLEEATLVFLGRLVALRLLDSAERELRAARSRLERARAQGRASEAGEAKIQEFSAKFAESRKQGRAAADVELRPFPEALRRLFSALRTPSGKIDHKEATACFSEALSKLQQELDATDSFSSSFAQEVDMLRRAGLQYWTKHSDIAPSKLCAEVEETLALCIPLFAKSTQAFRKILGRVCAMDNPDQAIAADASSNTSPVALAIKAIKTVVETHKPKPNTVPMTWTLFDAALQDCMALQLLVEKWYQAAQCNSPETQIVNISNLYWCWSTDRQAGVDDRTNTVILSLQRSCGVLFGRPQSEKDSGFFIPKLHKLARTLNASGQHVAATDTLKQAVQEAIATDTFQSAVIQAATVPLLSIWEQNIVAAELGQILRALVVWSVDIRDSGFDPGGFLDSLQLPTDVHGLMLEWLLVTMSHILVERQMDRKVRIWIESVNNTLCRLYDFKTYPLRRLRALIRVSGLLEADPEVADDQSYTTTAEKWLKDQSTLGYAKDEHLARFSQHLIASFQITLAFRRPLATADLLIEALQTWSALVARANTSGDIDGCIDDVDLWLSHLQSMSDYFDMQGMELERVKTLNLLTRALELLAAPTTLNSATVLTTLGSDLLRLGYSSKAGLCLAKGKYSNELDTSSTEKMHWHVTYAEYALGLGDVSKCDEHLLKAKTMFEEVKSTDKEQLKFWHMSKVHIDLKVGLSDGYYVSSLRALRSGCVLRGLGDAKKCVKLLQCTWTALETRYQASTRDVNPLRQDPPSDIDGLVESLKKVAVTVSPPGRKANQPLPVKGPFLWPLVSRLHRALLLCSKLCRLSAMYPEAGYYIERARKLSLGVGANSLLLRSLTHQGDLAARSGSLDAGKGFFGEADALQKQPQVTKSTALHYRSLGYLHHLQNHWQGVLDAYGSAETIVNTLSSSKYIDALMGDCCCSLLRAKDIQPTKAKAPTNTHNSVPRSKPVAKAKLNSRRKESNAPNDSNMMDNTPFASQLMTLKDDIQLRRAESLLAQGDAERASHILDLLVPRSDNIEHDLRHSCTRARQLLQSAINEMTMDPAFSMLAESTLSCPAISQNRRRKSSAVAIGNVGTQVVQSKKMLASPSPRKKLVKQPLGKQKVVQLLNLAYEALVEAVSRGGRLHSSTIFSQACALFTGISILTSYMRSSPGQQSLAPALLAHSLEAPRIVAAQRERQVVQQDKADLQENDFCQWPETHCIPGDASLGAHDFQSNFIDVIPDEWMAISLSLSEHRDALYVARYESGRHPFILRLPLARQSSGGVEEESFTFDEGKNEMLEIIRESDSTVHMGQETPELLNVKGAKTNWWAQREDLDNRLHELLLNIENIWLGGFSGILSQQPRHLELLARFRQTFENILQKHLPSRQRSSKTPTQARAVLDAHIFELFIGLGDPADGEVDLDEPLTDLLYFVVDVLQFHGEPNAYDEVDFDAMVVDTQDALRSYHEAASSKADDQPFRHTVLVLDKQLHIFPWESLPCLQSKSVSRVLSLVDLRDRAMALREQGSCSLGNAHINASLASGTYILNPSLDLPRTQTRFNAPLSSLSETKNWSSITARPPTEQEFTTALTPSAGSPNPNVLLYFGHGSGAQYIRSKTIKRLDACNVALLFGCSSASLKEAGEFEPYGMPRNYMLAGCPAVLGSLWDVTDGDCDAFAGAVLERWGLLAPGTLAEETAGKRSKKAKGRQAAGAPKRRPPQLDERDVGGMNLSEAVARSRGDCYLKYLNGAAMVVYGVPVKLQANA